MPDVRDLLLMMGYCHDIRELVSIKFVLESFLSLCTLTIVFEDGRQPPRVSTILFKFIVFIFSNTILFLRSKQVVALPVQGMSIFLVNV